MTTMVLPHVFLNPTPAVLVEESLRRSDAHLSYTGALVVQTGVFTGRSPGDRYIVADPAIHDLVWWGDINQPIAGHVFDDLEQRMRAHLAAHDTFVLHDFDLSKHWCLFPPAGVGFSLAQALETLREADLRRDG